MKKYKYIYGPVPSRRLGWSLGLDIIPLKTCSQNCRYCQLGMNSDVTIKRQEYVDISLVLKELERKLAEDVKIDRITISGSGEPTLNSGIGRLITGIKALTDIPMVVITNGSLLWDPQVRKELLAADTVMPSLDAVDQATFEMVNQPHKSITFEKHLEGLIKFRQEYSGQYWLEVFLLEGLNTSDQQIEAFAEHISRINPDRVQLNTAVRPVTDPAAKTVPQEKMNEIAKRLGGKAEVIAAFSKQNAGQSHYTSRSDVLETLKRRPCTIEGLSKSLDVNASVISKIISSLSEEKLIIAEQREEGIFYKFKLPGK
jgi:wyosine [tRNA(Phe)-imidazoG37] synthetase (radical SAM superfamily)